MSKSISLSDVNHAALRELLGTRVTAKAGLAIGAGDAAKVLIGNTVEYQIAGVMYSKTTAEIAFTDTTVQAISTTKFYLVCLNAAGTGLIVNGTAGEGLPATPDDYCPIGYVKVVTDATGTFVPATDDLSDAAVTDTYVDLAVKPVSVS